MTWKFHDVTREKLPARDFTKLNKMSLTQGFHKANEFSTFRRSNDARVKISKGKTALPLYIPEESFRYGKPNRPSTPVKLVIGNAYGLEYASRLNEEYKYIAESGGFRPKLKVRKNKASDLSLTYTKSKIDDLSNKGKKDYFKLTKFKKVDPKTNTHNKRFKKKMILKPTLLQIKQTLHFKMTKKW